MERVTALRLAAPAGAGDAAAGPAAPRSEPSPLRWELDQGPWYDNNLAVLEVRDEGRLHLRWVAGDIEGRPTDQPRLRTVSEVDVPIRR